MFKVNTVVYEIDTVVIIYHLKGGSFMNLPCGSRCLECSFLPLPFYRFINISTTLGTYIHKDDDEKDDVVIHNGLLLNVPYLEFCDVTRNFGSNSE